MNGELFPVSIDEQLERFDAQKDSRGLIFLSQLNKYANEPYVYRALLDAKKFKADAIYLRYFADGRPPVPQVYIYDFTTKSPKENEIESRQKELWNASIVPMFFVFTQTDVKILNNFNQLKTDAKGNVILNPIETIKLASTAERELKKIEEFSFRRIDNGTFWEQSSYSKEFKLQGSAYYMLLQQLKQSRESLLKKRIFKEKSTVNRLIVISVLIKYLEDRKDEQGNTVFKPGFFSEFSQNEDTYESVLKKKGAALKLFKRLSEQFNGKIFEWQDEPEIQELKSVDLSAFAEEFVSAKVTKKQFAFWKLYSFNFLPIELISNIYEEFLNDEPKERGVVYTPPFLVNLLIEEVMPLQNFKTKADFKILDPACGSGIFLVAAYKRMIEWWRIRNKWKQPKQEDIPELKKLLSNCIYGVDIKPEAVDLAYFSLSLALMGELSPKVIWEKFKFSDLREKTLRAKDFFELVEGGELDKKFDLVIGNPPFADHLTEAAQRIEANQIKLRKRPKLPDNQIALLFAEQSLELLKDDGKLCMILPSSPFLYNHHSLDFRKYFLETYSAERIFDFSHINRVLFGKRGDYATVALFASKSDKKPEKITHVVFKRTKSIKEKLQFEVDKYDFHFVPYEVAKNEKLIWKANFLGGGRMFNILKRISNFRSLGDFLKEKIEKNNWHVGEGLIVGNKKEIEELKTLLQKRNLNEREKESLDKLNKKYKKASYIHGSTFLPTSGLTEDGINWKKTISNYSEEYFNYAPNELLFRAPILLIKENSGKKFIPTDISLKNIAYKDKIVGIHAPHEDVAELKKVLKDLKYDSNVVFYLAGFSSQMLINKSSAILKSDIEKLPYPEDKSQLEIIKTEQQYINDTVEYFIDFKRQGENSKAVQPIGNAKGLTQFADAYCSTLNSVYKKFTPHEVRVSPNYIIHSFSYGKAPKTLPTNIKEAEKHLENLLKKDVHRSLRIHRVLRLYEDKIIYMVKPNQVRYWLPSIAVRDADETIGDLFKMGY